MQIPYADYAIPLQARLSLHQQRTLEPMACEARWAAR